MWIIRNGYVPASTVDSILEFMEGGDLPLAGDVDKTVANVPVDANSPVTIEAALAAQAVIAKYRQHIVDAHLQSNS